MDEGASEDGAVFVTQRRRELCRVPGVTPPLHYQSLLVERGTQPSHAVERFREFVVFHGEQVVPEYVVAFSRARDVKA